MNEQSQETQNQQGQSQQGQSQQGQCKPECKNDNLESLSKILGFNPLRNSPTKDSLTEALSELQAERTQEMKAKAKVQLKKAMELAEKGDKLDREYQKERSKMQKELGGIMRGIHSVMAGKEPEPEKTEGN